MTPLPPTTPPPAGTPTDTPAFRLWRHMMDEHKLTLLDSELHEIIRLSHPVILDELEAVRAHSVERAEEYCRLHDQLAAALKERDEARAKQPINTHIRLWDLVRYARAELHEDDLITDQEYADLCMGTKADQKLPGSPSPRRLEDYDDMRKELAALRQQLAGAEEAKGEVEANFNCFRCHDGHTPLYCLNCAGDLLKQSAWAQEAKVLLGEIAEVIETWAVGRHIMYSDRITGLLPRIKQAAQQSAPAPLKSDAL